jgi:hypothetical protein
MSQPTARPAGGRRPQQRHAANHATPVAQQPRDAPSVQSRAAAHDPATANPVLSVALPALRAIAKHYVAVVYISYTVLAITLSIPNHKTFDFRRNNTFQCYFMELKSFYGIIL